MCCWSFLFFIEHRQPIIHQRGSKGNAEGSIVSVTVPSVSVKWMKNLNRCDMTEMCFSDSKVGVLPSKF